MVFESADANESLVRIKAIMDEQDQLSEAMKVEMARSEEMARRLDWNRILERFSPPPSYHDEPAWDDEE